MRQDSLFRRIKQFDAKECFAGFRLERTCEKFARSIVRVDSHHTFRGYRLALLVAATSAWIAGTIDSTPAYRPTASHLVSTATNSTSHTIARTCDVGRTYDFPVPKSWSESISSQPPIAQMSSNGVLVVAIANPFGSGSTVLLRAFTTTCAPDLAFGHDGSELVNAPVQGMGVNGLVLSSSAPGISNSVIFAGGSSQHMFIGVIEADGQPDRAFGSDGWERLPWSPDPTALLQEPSAEILVGDSDGGGCCERQWVGALAANGSILRSFGTDGRVQIPFGGVEDEEIDRISQSSNGDLLILNTAAHMGLLETYVDELSPMGELETGFDQNYQSTVRRRVKAIFSGELVAGRGGFVVVGTSQNQLDDGVPDPGADGRFLAFDDAAHVVQLPRGYGRVRFESQFIPTVSVFPTPSGGYLMLGVPIPADGKPSTESTVQVVALEDTGAVDTAYGVGGRASIELPDIGPSLADSMTASKNSVAIVWESADGAKVDFIELTL